jgi:transposase
MEWSSTQLTELTDAGRRHRKPGVRVKALAVRGVALGHTQGEVAELFAVTRQSVAAWVQRYRAGGLSGLEVARGRGRRRRADEEEVVRYAAQSPRNFGVNRSRWTLKSLAETVPTLRGFSVAGVREVLRRCGLRYKRGQPWALSPDPEYEKKRQ